MKRDSVDRKFPFVKRKISEWGSGYEGKNKHKGGFITFLGDFHVYQAPKSNCFVASCAIGAHNALFNVNSNTSHIPHVCSMFN